MVARPPTETNPAGTLAFGLPVVIAVGSFPAALAEAGALDAMIEEAVARGEVSTPETTSMSRV
jgi:hypothetical protein